MARADFKKPRLSLTPELDLDSTLSVTYQLEQPLKPLASVLKLELEDIAISVKSKANPVKESLRLYMTIKNHHNKITHLTEKKEKIRQLITQTKELSQQLKARNLYLDAPKFEKLEAELNG